MKIERKNKPIDSIENLINSNISNKCKNIIEKYKIEAEDVRTLIEATMNEMKDFSKAISKLCRGVGKFNPELFDLIPIELFVSVIKHMKTNSFQRIERRNIGVSLVVFTNDNITNCLGTSICIQGITKGQKVDFKDFFQNKNRSLQTLYKCIDSDKYFFAYLYDSKENTVTFEGIKKFENNNLENICDESTIGFKLSSANQWIQIFNNKELVVSHFLCDASGNWETFINKELQNILQPHLKDVNKKNLKSLIQAVMHIAYMGSGAILLITSNSSKFESSDTPYILEEEDLIKTVDNQLIYDYAKYDGAVILEQKTNYLVVKKFGVILNPSERIKINDEYKELLHNTNSGTRHEKSVIHAIENPKDYLIVLSENKTISILHGEKPILWRNKLYQL